MRKILTILGLLICTVLCSCGKANGYNRKDLVPVNEDAGYAGIQVFIDGVWYYVPYVNENMVHDLGHELSPGASYALTYSLYPYGGKLNPGHYRIACCGIGDHKNNYYAEFNVMADGTCRWEIVEPTGG